MRDFLNTHLLNILLIIVCISPNFIFLRQDIWVEDGEYLLLYYTLFFSFYFFTCKFKKLNKVINIYLIFLSIIIFLGFDKNLKLWLFFQNIFVSYQLEKNIFDYLISFIFFIIVNFLIFKNLSKNEINLKKITLFTILSLSIFNISSDYFLDMRYKNLNKIIEKNKTSELDQNKTRNVIIFLDGLVGPGGIDDEIDKNIGAKKSILNLYKKHNFKLYTNAYSKYNETTYSMPAILNFDLLQKNKYKYVKSSILDNKSTNFIYRNKFLNDREKKIFATKNRIFNFCNKNVSECYSLNHNYPSKKKYISRFESLIKDLRNEHAILYQYLWRTLVLLEFKREFLFVTEKVFFEKDLDDLERLISNTYFDTYLTFYMYPHSPFIIEKRGSSCLFKKLDKNPFRNEVSRKELLKKHYQEIYCGNLIIDKFLDRLKKNNNFDNLNILILSDTGMKIGKGDLNNNDINRLAKYDKKFLNDAHKVLFAIKNGKTSYNIDENLISSQELFSKYYNKNHFKVAADNPATVLDIYKQVFVEFK